MKTKKITLIFVLFSILGTNSLKGQQLNFNDINFVNIKDGMSKRPVSKILEDKAGFMWFGTQGDGLYRFDGTNYYRYVYNFENENSIDSNFIYTIFLDSRNQLWVGTYNGLNKYNRNKDRFERVSLQNTAGVDDRIDVICLIEDDDNIVIGTYNKGMFKMSLDGTKISKVDLGPINENDLRINTLVKSSDGKIYAGTNTGLYNFDIEKNKLKDIKTSKGEKPSELNWFVRSMILDANGNLIVGTNMNGVYKLTRKNDLEITQLLKSKLRILSLLETSEHLLVGTESKGLMILDINGNLKYSYDKSTSNSKKLGSNSVWQLYADSQQRIWIGYFDAGVGVYDEHFTKFKSWQQSEDNANSLQGNFITDIQQDRKGRFWIGLSGGVDIYDPKTNTFEHINSSSESKYKGLEITAILSVFIDSKENVWVGSWDKGIYYLEKDSYQFKNYSTTSPNSEMVTDGIFGFTEDSKGNIIIASFMKGIHFYDAKNKKIRYCNSAPFVQLGITTSEVKTVLADSFDNIWIGTTTDLFKMNI